MDNPAIIAAWAAALAAVIGPVFGVFAAHFLARLQAKTTEAAHLFRRIMQDAQNYRHAFSDVYQYRRVVEEITEQYPVGATEGYGGGPGMIEEWRAQQARRQQFENLQQRAFREMRSIESLLNANVLSLGLLFDQSSEQCGRAIRDLIGMGEVFNCDTLPPFDECQDRLNDLIQRIAGAIRPLHDSLRNSDMSRN